MLRSFRLRRMQGFVLHQETGWRKSSETTHMFHHSNRLIADEVRDTRDKQENQSHDSEGGSNVTKGTGENTGA